MSSATSSKCPPGMARVPCLESRVHPKQRRLCMDRTEVTVAAYSTCVKAGTCSPARESKKEDVQSWNRCNSGVLGRDNDPVNCVSYEQAAMYCRFRHGRLPAENEWMGAVQAGLSLPAPADAEWKYPWGNAEPGNDEVCWKRKTTCPVASHPRDTSADGITDLAGNVGEWTETRCDDMDPSLCRSPVQMYIIKGGDFASTEADDLRADVIVPERATEQIALIGFRCVAD